jgi:hypothetical protein
MKSVRFRHESLQDLSSPYLIYSDKQVDGKIKTTEENLKAMLENIDFNVTYSKPTYEAHGKTQQAV